MVSRARTEGDRRVLPRDEWVARGMRDSLAASHHPYQYKLKYKSGTGRTCDTTVHAQTRLHAFAQMISEHAEEGRDFFVWNISRALRYQAMVRDY
jgi:hypothetical protein